VFFSFCFLQQFSVPNPSEKEKKVKCSGRDNMCRTTY
jgi:hypothetical protein